MICNPVLPTLPTILLCPQITAQTILNYSHSPKTTIICSCYCYQYDTTCHKHRISPQNFYTDLNILKHLTRPYLKLRESRTLIPKSSFKLLNLGYFLFNEAHSIELLIPLVLFNGGSGSSFLLKLLKEIYR